ncbi:MAG: LPS assembly lipoprotein LptE [Sneathiella sp.]
MLLFRKSLVICLIFLTAGCGFQPLYGRQTQNADVQRKLAATYVMPVEGRTGQIIRNELLDRITPTGIPARAAYRLKITTEEEKKSLAIDPDNSTNRNNLTLKAKFEFLGADGKSVIFKSTAQSVSSYNIVTSDFANLSAEKNARKRSALVIAEKIHRQLSVYLAQ